MKQQKGFTLIELIIVIVILGILAVTAAPRFFDFSKDARISTLGGLKAALQGAAQIEYANNAIKGNALNYPEATQTGIADAVGVLTGDTTEWVFDIDTAASGEDTAATFSVKGKTKTDNCYVRYAETKFVPATTSPPAAAVDAKFKVTIVSSGC